MFCFFCCQGTVLEQIEKEDRAIFERIKEDKEWVKKELSELGDDFSYILDIPTPFGNYFRLTNMKTNEKIEISESFESIFWSKVKESIEVFKNEEINNLRR